MLEQKINFPVKDLSLNYHLNPKMYVYLEKCVSCVHFPNFTSVPPVTPGLTGGLRHMDPGATAISIRRQPPDPHCFKNVSFDSLGCLHAP